ncbi:aldehyde dehydrogenase [Rhodovarius crocodyli]|uniref:Aldehyde dehydrogenase n=1 Tax=Rhodovarius crocodyli TaxID=1979269 RepID=A0A437LX41_9PROT|nr:aldehyde dehydrogenase [Rhodovarius crocodyli]
MRRLMLAAVLVAAPAFAQTPDGQEEISVLPEGPGQEEVFYGCSACHNTAVIRRSRLSREQWDGLMDWMVEKHGMTPLEPADRQVIVDYLARHFGPSQQRPGWRNPFLN